VDNKALWEQIGYVETDNMNKGAFWEALRNPDFRASCYNCVREYLSTEECEELNCRNSVAESHKEYHLKKDMWEWNGEKYERCILGSFEKPRL